MGLRHDSENTIDQFLAITNEYMLQFRQNPAVVQMLAKVMEFHVINSRPIYFCNMPKELEKEEHQKGWAKSKADFWLALEEEKSEYLQRCKDPQYREWAQQNTYGRIRQVVFPFLFDEHGFVLVNAAICFYIIFLFVPKI